MHSQDAPSTSSVTCSRCHAATTVPFTPTPGRPVYCKACFAKRNAMGPRAGMWGSNAAPRVRAPPARRMLSQRRKGHFVHDAMAELQRGGTLDENQRRAFVEMVFTRGARQTTEAAQEFVREKAQDDTLTPAEAERLARLLDRYSSRQ